MSWFPFSCYATIEVLLAGSNLSARSEKVHSLWPGSKNNTPASSSDLASSTPTGKQCHVTWRAASRRSRRASFLQIKGPDLCVHFGLYLLLQWWTVRSLLNYCTFHALPTAEDRAWGLHLGQRVCTQCVPGIFLNHFQSTSVLCNEAALLMFHFYDHSFSTSE